MILGFIFWFWRSMQIITLIPTVGMLVCPPQTPPYIHQQSSNPLPGLLRQHSPKSQPAHPLLRTRPLYCLHPRRRLGHRNPLPPQIHPRIRHLRLLYRPLLRRRLHRGCLLPSQHRQRELHQLLLQFKFRCQHQRQRRWRQRERIQPDSS